MSALGKDRLKSVLKIHKKVLAQLNFSTLSCLVFLISILMQSLFNIFLTPFEYLKHLKNEVIIANVFWKGIKHCHLKMFIKNAYKIVSITYCPINSNVKALLSGW